MEANVLRRYISDTREKTGIGWEVIEQDYALSCVLYGISSIHELKSSLVFKGGTALKKCYFGDYRFSQDLDFSVRGDSPKGEELLLLLQRACIQAERMMEDVSYSCKRRPEKASHPEQQEAFDINVQLPWHKKFGTSVKVEITMQEKVILPPEELVIINDYGSRVMGAIHVYKLEEIIAEKIRAILQFAKKLHERGWSRSRVRDYYDLWRILGQYEHSINKSILPELIHKKCNVKKVALNSVEDLFEGRLMEFLNEWDMWLSPLVADIPDRDMVINDLRKKLEVLLK